MNVLMLNSNDCEGGAARAAYRLHKGLLGIGINSEMLVQTRIRDEIHIDGPKTKFEKFRALIRPYIDALPVSMYTAKKQKAFSPSLLWNNISRKINMRKSDIVHLNWICGGFVPISELAKIDRPVVWTLHDMWAFTGGCHYAGECNKYKTHCNTCPQLGSKSYTDLSYLVWKRKNKQWNKLNFVIVSPSRWLAQCAKQSLILKDKRILVIPNGIDTTKFKPIEKNLARTILNLPTKKKLVLFGAVAAMDDERKGFTYLKSAIQKLAERSGKDFADVVIFGASQPERPMDIGFGTHFMGKIYDDATLACLYSAADVFVLPAIEDNLPNTVLESLACGTPCVSFEIGGLPDLIENRYNGYLAKPFDFEDLSRGIEFVLTDPLRWEKMSTAARQRILDDFEISKISQKYYDLYKSLVC